MQVRRIGDGELALPSLGVGCWAIGGPAWNLGLEMGWSRIDENDAVRGLQESLASGNNHFDTADVYGLGNSERLIGKATSPYDRRDFYLSSKIGYFQGTAPHPYHPKNIFHQVENSLVNLRTDYLDILYMHNFSFGKDDCYLEDAVRVFQKLVKDGKVRKIGMRGAHRFAKERALDEESYSNKYARFFDVADLIRPNFIQLRYNMLTAFSGEDRSDIFKWAEDNSVGVVINKPLAQGLLLDKYSLTNDPAFEDGDHRNKKRWFTARGFSILKPRIDLLRKKFGSDLTDMISLSINFCLSASKNAVVVTGFSNSQQLAQNLNSVISPLSDADIEYISNVMGGVNEELGNYV